MPFKGCLSDACVLMKIERFVLKPLRKIERFVLKQHTFRFADYTTEGNPQTIILRCDAHRTIVISLFLAAYQ